MRPHRATGHYYSIGLAADFTGFCPYEECEAKCNGCTLYRCPGCRHRWEWLDKSVPTAGFHRWAADEPKIYSTTFRLCVAARLDAATGDYWWTTIVCNGDLALYVCKAGLCKFELNLYAHILMPSLLNGRRKTGRGATNHQQHAAPN